MEEWKDIAGHEGLYQVSNLGAVRSLPRTWVCGAGRLCSHEGIVLSQFTNNSGYQICRMYKDGHQSKFLVHRLVAEAFLENPENKPTVNHKYGNKKQNDADCLEWATYAEQSAHATNTDLNDHRKIVLNTANGVFYDSVKEAAPIYGFTPKYLANMLRNYRKNKTPLVYV